MSKQPAQTHRPYQPIGRSERYTRWVIRNRWWVLFASLAVTVAAATGVTKLGLATAITAPSSREDNPDLAAYEAVEDIYTKNDNVPLRHPAGIG